MGSLKGFKKIHKNSVINRLKMRQRVEQSPCLVLLRFWLFLRMVFILFLRVSNAKTGSSGRLALLSREGRKYMEMAPHLTLWPGLCLTITVYSLNMFGDAMRDLLDPRLRGGQGSYGTAKMKRKRGLLSRLLNPFAQQEVLSPIGLQTPSNCIAARPAGAAFITKY